MRRDAKKSFIFFPVDELDKFFVTVPMLELCKTTAEIQKFLAFQMDKIFNLFQDVKLQIGRQGKNNLSSILIRDIIAIATLQEIKKDHYRVLEQFTKLTPLRMWWHALKFSLQS